MMPPLTSTLGLKRMQTLGLDVREEKKGPKKVEIEKEHKKKRRRKEDNMEMKIRREEEEKRRREQKKGEKKRRRLVLDFRDESLRVRGQPLHARTTVREKTPHHSSTRNARQWCRKLKTHATSFIGVRDVLNVHVTTCCNAQQALPLHHDWYERKILSMGCTCATSTVYCTLTNRHLSAPVVASPQGLPLESDAQS